MLDRLYRLVLLAFPAAMRRRWGGDMAQLLRDQMQDAKSRGDGQARVFALAMWDAVQNGLRARLDHRWSRVSKRETSRVAEDSTGLREGMMDWTAALRQDLGYSVRQIGRRPAFAVATVLVLALGIGANTAVFSVVDGVLLQSVPLSDADRLVRVSQVIPNFGEGDASLPGFQDWARAERPFEALGGFHSTVHSLDIGGTPERIIVGSTIGDVFGAAGLSASLGRTYPPTDPGAASEPVLLLTDGFWRRAFGADRAVVGQSVELDGRSVRILGVLPPEEQFLRFGREIDAWAPMDAPLPWMGRGTGFITVIGRLQADLSPAAAEESLQALGAGLMEAGTTENGISMVPLKDDLVADSRSLLLALQGAALLLMLVVAINAANLLLARSLERSGEFAVRTALGAGRGRIARQVMVETTLLALLGGGVGLGLALLGRGMILRLIPDLAVLAGPATISWTVLLYTFGTAVATGLLAGLWPAMRAGARSWSSMKTGVGRRAVGGAQRGRKVMVALEIGLALVLIVSSGLMVRTLSSLMAEDLGFEPGNVITARIALAEARYPEWAQRHGFWDDLVARVREVPGVEAVGLTSALPLSQTPDGGTFEIEGRVWEVGDGPSLDKKTASPGYFAAMGIPVLEGRAFDGQDRSDAPLVTIVSESMAQRFFPDEPAVGKKIRVGWWGNDFVEIVGVVGDVKQRGPDQGLEIAAYLPQTQTGAPGATLVIKAVGDPYALTGAVREAVLDLDQGQPIYGVATLDDLRAGSMARRSALTSLLLGLALIALVISCLGVYALTAHSVGGRRQEIGVRMALGATGNAVLRSVVLSEGRVVAVGLLIGLGAAAVLTRVFDAMLFGITPWDPLTLSLSVAMLGAVAFLAILAPALRAARTDPSGALAWRD